MNLVMADTEEFRRVKRKPTKGQAPGAADPAYVETEEKRTLGLTIVRGAHIVATTVEGPPPADPSARLGKEATGPGGAPAAMSAGPGISRPAGRGLPSALTGPAAGVGGPGFGGPGGFGGPPTGFAPGGPPPFGGRGGPPGPRKSTSRSGEKADANRAAAGGFQPQGFGGPPVGFGGPRKLRLDNAHVLY